MYESKSEAKELSRLPSNIHSSGRTIRDALSVHTPPRGSRRQSLDEGADEREGGTVPSHTGNGDGKRDGDGEGNATISNGFGRGDGRSTPNGRSSAGTPGTSIDGYMSTHRVSA